MASRALNKLSRGCSGDKKGEKMDSGVKTRIRSHLLSVPDKQGFHQGLGPGSLTCFFFLSPPPVCCFRDLDLLTFISTLSILSSN